MWVMKGSLLLCFERQRKELLFRGSVATKRDTDPRLDHMRPWIY